MQNKNYKDFCLTKQTRIIVLFFGDFFVSVGSFFGYDPCLFGKAEILVIFGCHFGRNDDLIKWINNYRVLLLVYLAHKLFLNLTDL